MPAEGTPDRLNLGSGNDYRPGWVNLDLNPTGNLRVDVNWNFVETPWPFPDDSFRYVLASHVFEHVPHTVAKSSKDGLIVVMEEAHRVLRHGGTLFVIGPHPEGASAWVDPTHTRLLYPAQFRYFEPEHSHNFYTAARFRVATVETTRWPLLGGRVKALDAIYKRFPAARKVAGVKPSEIRIALTCIKSKA